MWFRVTYENLSADVYYMMSPFGNVYARGKDVALVCGEKNYDYFCRTHGAFRIGEKLPESFWTTPDAWVFNLVDLRGKIDPTILHILQTVEGSRPGFFVLKSPWGESLDIEDAATVEFSAVWGVRMQDYLIDFQVALSFLYRRILGLPDGYVAEDEMSGDEVPEDEVAEDEMSGDEVLENDVPDDASSGSEDVPDDASSESDFDHPQFLINIFNEDMDSESDSELDSAYHSDNNSGAP